MALLNVRLDAADTRKANALRKIGVAISALVRATIRAEYDRRLAGVHLDQRPSQVVAEILASLPDPPRSRSRRFALTDRHAVQRHIATKLRRRQR